MVITQSRYHRVIWWQFLIVVYMRNGISVKGILFDTDANIVHKICQVKFCDASKTDVSGFLV